MKYIFGNSIGQLCVLTRHHKFRQITKVDQKQIVSHSGMSWQVKCLKYEGENGTYVQLIPNLDLNLVKTAERFLK